MLSANAKLLNFAKKINNATIEDCGITRGLSQTEKYLACYLAINEIEYFEDGLADDSRNYVEVINKLKGCCVGKATALSVLLKAVGIDACVISSSAGVVKNKKLITPSYMEQSPMKLNVKKVADTFLHGETDSKDIKKLEKSASTKKFWRTKSKMGYILFADHAQTLISLKDEVYDVNCAIVGDPTWGDGFREGRNFINFSEVVIGLKNYLTFLRPINLGLSTNEAKRVQEVLDRALDCGDAFEKETQKQLKCISPIPNNAITDEERIRMAESAACLSVASSQEKPITFENWKKAAKIVIDVLPKMFPNNKFFETEDDNEISQ